MTSLASSALDPLKLRAPGLVRPPEQFQFPAPQNGAWNGTMPAAQPGQPTASYPAGQFSAQSNLRGVQLTPGQQGPAQSPRVSQYQQRADQAAGDLANGPDRFALAQSQWDNFARATAPQYEQSLNRATELAAAQGQTRSGMLRTQYGNIANDRALALDTQRSTLLNSALEGTIGDRQANATLAQGYEQNVTNAERADRGEVRTERDYQTGQAESALDRQIQQYMLAQQAQSQAFGQAATQYQLGTQGNPANAYSNAANQYQQQAQGLFAGIGQLAAGSAQNAGTRGGVAQYTGQGGLTPEQLAILKQYQLRGV
jgi:hypothetical protein